MSKDKVQKAIAKSKKAKQEKVNDKEVVNKFPNGIKKPTYETYGQ